MTTFYISNLPGAPFDYWWEVHPHFEERVTRNYIGRPAHLDPVPEELSYETVRVKGEWELRMMHQVESRIEKSIISSLDDDTLRFTAKKMAEAFVLRNRVVALEEEPARLKRDDDPS
jgi:hypothetical protein